MASFAVMTWCVMTGLFFGMLNLWTPQRLGAGRGISVRVFNHINSRNGNRPGDQRCSGTSAMAAAFLLSPVWVHLKLPHQHAS
jgi:hypothetical protein